VAAEFFADVLDDALARAGRLSATWTAPPVHDRQDVFLFSRPLTQPRSPWGASAPIPKAMPRRTPHALSPAQQHAFDVFVTCGAAITPDFDVEALRREYRRLALALHPDRLQARGEVSGDQTARRFADVTAAYRALRAVVEQKH
jgi:DnaJ domain